MGVLSRLSRPTVYHLRATRPMVLVTAFGRNLVGRYSIHLIPARQHPLFPFFDTDRHATPILSETIERKLAGRAQEFGSGTDQSVLGQDQRTVDVVAHFAGHF